MGGGVTPDPRPSYNITLDTSKVFPGDTCTIDKTTAHEGETVTLTYTGQYDWRPWVITLKDTETEATLQTINCDGSTEIEFTMLGQDITVDVAISWWSTVTVNQTTGGTLTSSVNAGWAGNQVTFTGQPSSGYSPYQINISTNATVDDPGTYYDFSSGTYQMNLPYSNVTAYAVWKPNNAYNVTIDESSFAPTITVNSDKQFAIPGEIVTLTEDISESDYWQLAGIDVKNANNESQVTTYEAEDGIVSFPMPSYDVIVYCHFNARPTPYTIYLDQNTGGTLSCNKEEAYSGDEIVFSWTYTPPYNSIVTINVVNSSGTSTIQTLYPSSGQTSITYTMPSQDIRVTANFSQPSYTITTQHGSTPLSANKTWGYQGDVVTFTTNSIGGTIPTGIKITRTSDGSDVTIVPVTNTSGNYYEAEYTIQNFSITATPVTTSLTKVRNTITASLSSDDKTLTLLAEETGAKLIFTLGTGTGDSTFLNSFVSTMDWYLDDASGRGRLLTIKFNTPSNPTVDVIVNNSALWTSTNTLSLREISSTAQIHNSTVTRINISDGTIGGVATFENNSTTDTTYEIPINTSAFTISNDFRYHYE